MTNYHTSRKAADRWKTALHHADCASLFCRTHPSCFARCAGHTTLQWCAGHTAFTIQKLEFNHIWRNLWLPQFHLNFLPRYPSRN